MVLADWNILNQTTFLIEICSDNEVERETCDLLKHREFVPILYLQEAFIPLLTILIWPYKKEVHDPSLFDYNHDRMDRGKGNIDDPVFEYEYSLYRELF